MTEFALPCIVCGKPLKNVDGGDENVPLLGVAFSSFGNYGSTVWDDVHEQLEISVCDTCLLRAGDAGRVLMFRKGKAPLWYVPWTPPEDRDRTLMENERRYGAHGQDQPYGPAYEEVGDEDAV